MSNSTIFRVRRLFHPCNSGSSHSASAYLPDSDKSGSTLIVVGIGGSARASRISRIFQGIFPRIHKMYIFSCCSRLSARGKLLVNQIQLLPYVFWRDGSLTRFLNQVLISMRSPSQRNVYLCMIAYWGGKGTQNKGCHAWFCLWLVVQVDLMIASPFYQTRGPL